MAKVIKIKQSDLVRIVEEALRILPNSNDLPKQLGELEKMLNEGKRTINRIYNFVMDLSFRQILEESDKYDKLLQDIGDTKEGYSKKYEHFNDIIESYWDAYINDELDFNTIDTYNKYNRALSEFDTLTEDMKTLYDIYEELHDTVRRKNIFTDFTTTYPNQTINISTALNKDNDENQNYGGNV
jgi:uncharacterized protein YukE